MGWTILVPFTQTCVQCVCVCVCVCVRARARARALVPVCVWKIWTRYRIVLHTCTGPSHNVVIVILCLLYVHQRRAIREEVNCVTGS
jgi:hypothetical protein